VFVSGSLSIHGGKMLTVGINLGLASMSTGMLYISDFAVATKLLLLSMPFPNPCILLYMGCDCNHLNFFTVIFPSLYMAADPDADVMLHHI
jgi:hypothetical protein